MSESTEDLTVKVLQDIRQELRDLRGEMREENRAMREETRAMREDFTGRFEVIETTLRDLAQQLVMLARGVKVAIKHRRQFDEQLADHERRIGRLEKREP